MSGKHRYRVTSEDMCWVSVNGHLCRTYGEGLTRTEMGLTSDVLLEHGDLWRPEDKN